jgi:hypothetical protein
MASEWVLAPFDLPDMVDMSLKIRGLMVVAVEFKALS